jgi:hypothetical protein
MTKTEKRILSGGVGAVLFVIAITLQNEFPDRPREVQIAVWTLITMTIAALGNYEHVREQWFWKGFV